MPIYILYSPIYEKPLFTNSTSPYRYGMCSFCNNSNKIRNLHYMIGPKLKNVDYVSYPTHTFCIECCDKYRNFRPSADELQLRIYKITLCKIIIYINIHLPECLSLLICKFIKYP